MNTPDQNDKSVNVEKAVGLIPVGHSMIFRFVDTTGRSHGDFQKNNPISSCPNDAIGAVKLAGVWHWVVPSDHLSTLTAENQELREKVQKLQTNSQNALGWFDFDHLKAAASGDVRLSGDAVRDLGYVKDLLEKNINL